MKIVAPDSFAADFDGLRWEECERAGEFIRYPRSTPEELLERAAGATALIVNKVRITADVMDSLPELRYVGITATGTNNVDLAHARRKEIAVTNVPAYSTDSIAELVFSFILAHSSKVPPYDALVKNGEWEQAPDFCVPRYHAFELRGKTLGIIGRGRIGSRVAELAAAFGMTVLTGEVPGRTYAGEAHTSRVGLPELCAAADFVTLHCPLTPQTERMIDSSFLKLMKRTALLINTSRGGLVDEQALAAALASGQIGGAAVDVLSEEPPAASNALLRAPNITITPHIGWSTQEARVRLVTEVGRNLTAWMRGETRNRVERPA